jgi:hypothetical protein
MHIFNDHSVGVLPVLEEVYSCSTQRPGFDKGARSPLLHQNKREMWIGLGSRKDDGLVCQRDEVEEGGQNDAMGCGR